MLNFTKRNLKAFGSGLCGHHFSGVGVVARKTREREIGKRGSQEERERERERERAEEEQILPRSGEKKRERERESKL